MTIAADQRARPSLRAGTLPDRIVRWLDSRGAPDYVASIAAELQADAANVSGALSGLRRRGLVVVDRQEGHRKYYAAAPNQSSQPPPGDGWPDDPHATLELAEIEFPGSAARLAAAAARPGASPAIQRLAAISAGREIPDRGLARGDRTQKRAP